MRVHVAPLALAPDLLAPEAARILDSGHAVELQVRSSVEAPFQSVRGVVICERSWCMTVHHICMLQ